MRDIINMLEQEKFDLDVKLAKLTSFLTSVDALLVVGKKQYDLLLLQQNIMTSFSLILDFRIKELEERKNESKT